jgi:competence protein ComEC
VFESREGPVIVAQRPGYTTAIATTPADQVDHLLQPFFAKQGINHIDCPVFVPIGRTQTESLNHCSATTWYAQSPPILALEFAGQRWWIFWQIPDRNRPAPPLPLEQRPDVLVWPGSFFPDSWLDQLRPTTAIAVSPYGSDALRQTVERFNGQLWVTGEDGAVQWTPRMGFSATLNAMDANLR